MLMTDIPGAREELERLGLFMHVQVRELVSRLTPEARVFPQELGVPSVSDWHEPLQFHHTMTFRGARPETVSPAEMGQRAAKALAAAGWAVEEKVTEAHFITGRHDGVVVQVRISKISNVVLYQAKTPSLAFHTAEVMVKPDPVRTPDTLRPGYVLCYECDGLGWCSSCWGRSWIPDVERGRRRCPECHQDRVCPICRGAGEKHAATLQYYERGYYPGLSGE
ncbi:hypothetical protein ACFY7H_29470 [Streptomyces sp. NPDC012794]|uniref:hypothetical protein n=1 Tax=Streptomyces sp. NPDC012794 TaxID=3364850 RepID=UPI00369703CA